MTPGVHLVIGFELEGRALDAADLRVLGWRVGASSIFSAGMIGFVAVARWDGQPVAWLRRFLVRAATLVADPGVRSGRFSTT
jgi:hypothetical protein